MRYRPFGKSGKAVSAVSLLLRETSATPTPADWRNLLYSAFESGVNCFETLDGGHVLTAGFAQAISSVERGLLFLGWRIAGDPRRPLTGQALSQIIRNALRDTGAGYFDLLMLDEAAFDSLTPDGREFLGDVRSAGLALQIGMSGDGPAVEAVIADPTFEVLAMPFSLVSDWRARRRVKDAGAGDMTAIAYDPLPVELLKAQPRLQRQAPTLLNRGRAASPLAGAGTYAFLHETRGWTPEELCVSYALTEPAFATVQLDAAAGLDITKLAAVPDRDMPTGVAAQIEMARFGAVQGEQKQA